MRVLFTTLREKSHFFALLPFIEACQHQGHEVAVAAPEDFRQRVASADAQFFAMGHPGDAGLTPIWQRMRVAPEAEQRRLAMGELFAGACAGAAVASLLDIIGSWRPALVVRESCEYGALVAAEKASVPHARVAICAQGAEAEAQQHAAPFVETHRRAVNLPHDSAANRFRAEPVFTLFPAAFEQAEPTSTAVRRFRTLRGRPPALPDWWGANDSPFVYATLGTVTGGFDLLRAMYKVLLESVAALPLRVLLTVGADMPVSELGEIPSNVRVERFVPQDEVIPHAAAVLCHGGSGTVVGALAAGVPLLVAPMFADQPYNAHCVAALGAGLALPSRNASAEALRSALTRVVGEASFRIAAARLATQIAALPLVDEAFANVAASQQ